MPRLQQARVVELVSNAPPGLLWLAEKGANHERILVAEYEPKGGGKAFLRDFNLWFRGLKALPAGLLPALDARYIHEERLFLVFEAPAGQSARKVIETGRTAMTGREFLQHLLTLTQQFAQATGSSHGWIRAETVTVSDGKLLLGPPAFAPGEVADPQSDLKECGSATSPGVPGAEQKLQSDTVRSQPESSHARTCGLSELLGESEEVLRNSQPSLVRPVSITFLADCPAGASETRNRRSSWIYRASKAEAGPPAAPLSRNHRLKSLRKPYPPPPLVLRGRIRSCGAFLRQPEQSRRRVGDQLDYPRLLEPWHHLSWGKKAHRGTTTSAPEFSAGGSLPHFAHFIGLRGSSLIARAIHKATPMPSGSPRHRAGAPWPCCGRLRLAVRRVCGGRTAPPGAPPLAVCRSGVDR